MARAGLIVRHGSERCFVPAELCKALVPATRTTEVPGTALSLSLVGGHVVTVIELAGASDVWLVCELRGQTIAFAGLEFEHSGYYEVLNGSVQYDGESLRELDVERELLRVEHIALEHSMRATAQESSS